AREQLRRDEDLLPRNAALADRGADVLLVTVGGSRVDVPVARLERREHHAAGLRAGRRLVDAEAEPRHLDTVIERRGGGQAQHHMPFGNLLRSSTPLSRTWRRALPYSSSTLQPYSRRWRRNSSSAPAGVIPLSTFSASRTMTCSV